MFNLKSVEIMIETEYGLCYEKGETPSFDDFCSFIKSRREWCFSLESANKTWDLLQKKEWKTKFGTITRDWSSYSLYWYDKINDSYK